MCGVQSGELLEDSGPGLALLRGVVNARDGVPHLMVPCQVGDVHPPPLVPGVLETLQAGTALSSWQQEGPLEVKCGMVAGSLSSSLWSTWKSSSTAWIFGLESPAGRGPHGRQGSTILAKPCIPNGDQWLAAVIWTSGNFGASMSLLLVVLKLQALHAGTVLLRWQQEGVLGSTCHMATSILGIPPTR